MKNSSPENFSRHSRAVVVAPAGCGKTELIARSVSHCNGRQLILTHTHAGVDSLRKRLQKLKIHPSAYTLDTIHSFALRYASAYPTLSGITTSKPKKQEDYQNVLTSANILFDTRLARDILNNSYSGLFVDEYQDCTLDQHELIIKLAKNFPCRIVGDPLQGIFDFGDNQIVDWEKDVYRNFERLENLNEPWRWKNTNPQLGEWLTQEVRHKLLNCQPISITKNLALFGCTWDRFTHGSLCGKLYNCLKYNEDIFVICDPVMVNQPHQIAKRMKNHYKSIEPVTSDNICHVAALIENKSGYDRLKTVYDFAFGCLTGIKQDCSGVLKSIKENKDNLRAERKRKLKELSTRIVENESLSPIIDLYGFLESEYNPTFQRQQLWIEMKKGLTEVIEGNIDKLEDAVWSVRNRMRFIGRRIPKRCISRTLLLKGLECNHSVIVNADALDIKNLYVALTRASKSICIMSNIDAVQASFTVLICRTQILDCSE